MAWISPKDTWVAGDGIGFSDLNRIEGNVKHIYEIGVAPITAWSISKSSGTAILCGADKDVACVFGRTRVSNSIGDHMVLSHYDLGSTTNYALVQSSSGTTVLNAPSTTEVRIASNGATVSSYSGTAITLKQPTTVESGLVTINSSGLTSSDTIITLKKGTTIEGNTVVSGGFLQVDANGITSSTSTISMLKDVVCDQDLSLLSSVTYNDSANKSLEIGAINDTAVNSGATYKWRQYVSGDANGQNWALQQFQNGGGAYETIIETNKLETKFKKDIVIDGKINPTTTPPETVYNYTSGSAQVYLPRGSFTVFVQGVATSGSTAVTIDKYIAGAWVKLADVLTTGSSADIISYITSTGSTSATAGALRINYSIGGTGSVTVTTQSN